MFPDPIHAMIGSKKSFCRKDLIVMYGTDAIPDFIRNDETFRMLSYKDMFIETTRGRAMSILKNFGQQF